jgi:hypothetical protein
MSKRGRPKGSVVQLLDDPGRFEVAAWLAFSELLGPYAAAYLTMFLVTCDGPITTASIDDVLLKSTTLHRTRVIGHADRIRRKAPEVFSRADDRGRAWASGSAASIIAVVKFAAAGDRVPMVMALEQMRAAGWSEILDRLRSRIDASLRSNFPPAEGPLSRAAARLLQKARCQPQAKAMRATRCVG